MKTKTLQRIIPGVILICIFIGGVTKPNISTSNPHILKLNFTLFPRFSMDSAPITIDGNSQFTIDNGVIAGNGTFSNPYLIANWVINITDSSGITIANTTAYAIIENCSILLENTYYSSNPEIYLKNASNIAILNNSIIGNFYGIYLESSNNNTITDNTPTSVVFSIYTDSSDNNTITNNTMTDSSYGIYLKSANDTSIINNTASDVGEQWIYLDNSNNNIILNNINSGRCYEGIFLDSSSNNNILSNNILTSSGFEINHSINNSLDTSNKVNGKSLRYYENQNDLLLTNMEDVGQVILINCNFSIIENLTIANSTIAISVQDSNNNTVINNNVSENQLCGIELVSTINSFILNNTVSASVWGIQLESSNNNFINENNASANGNLGSK